MKALYSIAILAVLFALPAVAAETVKCRENVSFMGGAVAKVFDGNTCPKGWHPDRQAHPVQSAGK